MHMHIQIRLCMGLASQNLKISNLEFSRCPRASLTKLL